MPATRRHDVERGSRLSLRLILRSDAQQRVSKDEAAQHRARLMVAVAILRIASGSRRIADAMLLTMTLRDNSI